MNVPIGFRFRPTDLELILHYLHPKILGLEMAAPFIPERDIYSREPWLLDRRKTNSYYEPDEWYYFTKRNHMGGRDKGTRPNRVLDGGWWRANAVVSEISDPSNGKKIGSKRTLTFFRFKKNSKDRKQAVKTNWIMHEYCLISVSVEEWCVCKIRYNRKKTRGAVASSDDEDDIEEPREAREEEDIEEQVDNDREIAIGVDVAVAVAPSFCDQSTSRGSGGRGLIQSANVHSCSCLCSCSCCCCGGLQAVDYRVMDLVSCLCDASEAEAASAAAADDELHLGDVDIKKLRLSKEDDECWLSLTIGDA